MDLQNLLPHQAHPIQRTTAGQLPAELAELSEEALGGKGLNVLASGIGMCCSGWMCSYEGDDAE
uniref:Uncharacterized protein n=1 Tax=Cyanothece sp. (strain PCC 7425 / ATCC 29141) TaxID=395961 RepID=B8HTY8_CYAP4